MKYTSAKISLFILLCSLFFACDAVKKVPIGKHLLVKNEILVNNKKTDNEKITSQLSQIPNSTIFGFKLKLNMFNKSRNNPDSVYKLRFKNNDAKYKRMAKWLSKKQVDRLGKSFWYSGWYNFLRKNGEPPVIINEQKTQKSLARLKQYYFNNGYFETKAEYKIDSIPNKRGKISYKITTGDATFLDTISREIENKVLDSLYLVTQYKSFLKTGDQYNVDNFDLERNRIANYYVNHGVYHFQLSNINFEVNNSLKNNKAPIKLKITNQIVKNGDSTTIKPYKIYKISEVNVFTNNTLNKNKAVQVADSVQYNNFNLFSPDKLHYRPSAITDAIFIQKDSLYSENKVSLTRRSLSNLRVFNYPNIQFVEDSISKTLKANIYLTAKEKYSLNSSFDATHSNIQNVGIAASGSLSIRNVFNGCEILEIGLRGNLGSSNDFANPDNQFFNISEYGADLKLYFPKLLLPFKTNKIIPKTMFPASYVSSGFAKQRNIGLDKENFTTVFNYNWAPKKNVNAKLDLINLQYVKNINTINYFNVYNSSYNRLNQLAGIYNTDPTLLNEDGSLTVEAGGADSFIYNALNNAYPLLTAQSQDLKTIKSIQERKDRLTENNLILATNFSYSIDSKVDLFDKQFFIFKGKVEFAGNAFSLIANLAKRPKDIDGQRDLFGLQYSQYGKIELDYVRHWDLSAGKIIAVRSFFGLAIPYGNSNSVPFSRSYFAGGSNDNRGWQSYSLGPGSSGGLNDFNDANMKIALSAEFRFKYFNNLNGALFADLGNIWNVLDNEKDETKVFSGLSSLKNLALGTGTGIRYDFKFFLLRLDLGFKTYNPAKEEGRKWFQEYNWKNSVINIGINYPF